MGRKLKVIECAHPTCVEKFELKNEKKKYCSHSCRSHDNRLKNSNKIVVIQSENSVLRANYEILKKLFGEGNSVVLVTQNELKKYGFEFWYFTGFALTDGDKRFVKNCKIDQLILWCYNLGLYPIDSGYTFQWHIISK